MSKQQFEILSASALSTLIGRIGKTTVMRERMIQQAAVQCIIQSLLHSNVTPAMQLFDAAGKGTRRDSLVTYLEVWGQIAYLKSEGKLGFFKREPLVAEVVVPEIKAVAATETDAAVEAEPAHVKAEYVEKITTALWYNARPEPTIKSVFDADKEIYNVLERLSKQANKPGVEIKARGLLSHMVAAYTAYSHEQYGKETADVTTLEADQKEDDHAEANAANADPAKLAQLQAHFQPLVKAA